MPLLQALISLIGKSAGKILNAIFGWAVVALFGRTSPNEQILLSGLVGAAAAWPLLAVGVAFPKITTLVVAFVPMSNRAPTSLIRLIWLGLALLVPLVVGIVVAARTPAGATREHFVLRALRGFPVTLGIAGAFLIMFVTVPVLRVTSALKGRQDEHVPCITDGDAYEVVTAQIDAILRQHEIDATRGEPSWWLVGPSKLLGKLGGKALRGYAPDRLAYWKGPQLEVAFYPSDILVRGTKSLVAWTHGLLAEAISRGPGLQTFDPAAQDLERQIQQVWRVYAENPHVHAKSPRLQSRVVDIARSLGGLKIDYDAWQIVYRELMQLARALKEEAQLLESLVSTREVVMQSESKQLDTLHPLASASTGELMEKLANQTAELAKKHMDLAKAEIRTELKSELKMAKGLGVAAILGLMTLNLLLVAVVLALSESLGGWTAALVVAGATLLIAAIAAAVGWAQRVTKPLAKTQKVLEEDARWAKERMT